MKMKFKIQNSKFKKFFPLLVACHLLLVTVSNAKVYIDITSPAVRKLPISITSEGPSAAKEIEGIIRNDLESTGLFSFVSPDVPGAEMTVQLKVDAVEEIKALWSLNDLIENREIIMKQYSAPPKNIRTIAHQISNDIYKIVTEKEGVFRTKITYLSYASPDNKELHLTDWDGHNGIKVIPLGLTSSHSWHHDSRFLIYSSERYRGWKIYLFDLGEFREKLLFSSKGLNLAGNASPSGDVTFSSSQDGNSEIYVMDTSGGKPRKLTASFGIDVSPSFSPDGMNIAFVSDRGGTPQIYLMDSNGRGIRRLTFEGSYNTSPAWSPDGKWLAYVGQRSGKNQIFVIQFDGTGQRQITFSGNNEGPSFSPDGLFLAFDSDRDGSRGIYIMRVNGEDQRRITPKNIKAMSPKWSPFFK
ncbi:MAG: PD40 domain-containing protein [Nitrospirae bacterium]|nr:PD40 domain-containing protein [Nitrospirota bacterium]